MLHKLFSVTVAILNGEQGCHSDKILNGDQPSTIPAKIGLIWLSGLGGDDLNLKILRCTENG
jgi:hypothetical protein